MAVRRQRFAAADADWGLPQRSTSGLGQTSCAGYSHAMCWCRSRRSIVLLYTVVSAVYIILENRSPQSTFAWLFLFLLAPGHRPDHLPLHRAGLARLQPGELSSPGRSLAANSCAICARSSRASRRVRRPDRPRATALLPRETVAAGPSAATIRSSPGSTRSRSCRTPRRNIRASSPISAPRGTTSTSTTTSGPRISFTLEVKAVLIERARAGVEVRCLFDTSGGALSKELSGRSTRRRGGKIHPYLDFRSFTKLHSINYRSHRKIAVIDGTDRLCRRTQSRPGTGQARQPSTAGAIPTCGSSARRRRGCRPAS